jgi:hypothetical protein
MGSFENSRLGVFGKRIVKCTTSLDTLNINKNDQFENNGLHKFAYCGSGGQFNRLGCFGASLLSTRRRTSAQTIRRAHTEGGGY